MEPPRCAPLPAVLAVLALLTVALATVAPAAAAAPVPEGESFHFVAGEALALQPGALREPLSSGVTACVLDACARHTEVHWHVHEFTSSGYGRPVRTHVWIDVTRPVAGVNECVLQAYVEVRAPNGERKWYWSVCVGLEVLGIAADTGLHEVAFDWPSHYSDVAISPGDELHAALWTAGTSLPLLPSMFLVADAEHPSHFVMSGVKETVPAPPEEPPAQPGTVASNSTTPAPRPTSKPPATSAPPQPPATTTPEPAATDATQEPATARSKPPAARAGAAGAAVALSILAAGWAARRRLA